MVGGGGLLHTTLKVGKLLGVVVEQQQMDGVSLYRRKQSIIGSYEENILL